MRFAYWECRDCGSTFIDPVPSSDEFDALYQRASYHDVHYAEAGPTREHGECIAFLRGIVPEGASLLDFGCGNGAFMLAARQAGYGMDGVEQGASSIEMARQNTGLRVTTLEQALGSGRRYDAVHIADVLEHLPQPSLMLRRLEALLAPAGMFVVEGPLEKQPSLVYFAAAGFKRLRRLAGRDRAGAHPPFHLTFTSWASQRHFFEQVMGYECLAVQLYETGWPYPVAAAPGAGIGQRLKALIGRTAVKTAAGRVGRRLRLANRFRAIIRP